MEPTLEMLANVNGNVSSQCKLCDRFSNWGNQKSPYVLPEYKIHWSLVHKIELADLLRKLENTESVAVEPLPLIVGAPLPPLTSKSVNISRAQEPKRLPLLHRIMAFLSEAAENKPTRKL